MNYENQRQQLIEIASRRPDDIKDFYAKYLVGIDDCTFLSADAPKTLSVFYRGKLKDYDAASVPSIISGKDPNGRRQCGIHGCINPNHILAFK
jgi:hypothetical protein